MKKMLKKTALLFLAGALILTGCSKSGGENQTKKMGSEKGKTIVVSMYTTEEGPIEIIKMMMEAASSKGDYNVDLRVVMDKDMSYDKYLLKINKELSLGEVDIVLGNMKKILNFTPTKVNLESFYEKNNHIFKSLQYKYMIPIFASVEQVIYDQKAIKVKGLDPDWNTSKERDLVLNQLKKGDISLNHTNIMRATCRASQERMFMIENDKLVKNTKVIESQLQWVNDLVKSAKTIDWDSFEAEAWNPDEPIAGAPKVQCENILNLDPVFEFSKGYEMIYQVNENTIYPHVYGAYINNWNKQIEGLMTYLVSDEAQMLTEIEAISPAGHISDINAENFKIIADHKQASEHQRKVFKSINDETVKILNREQALTYEESYGLMNSDKIQYYLLMAYHKNGEAGMKLQVDEWETQLNEKLSKIGK